MGEEASAQSLFLVVAKKELLDGELS